MNRAILFFLPFFFIPIISNSQDLSPIKLNAPNLDRGLPVMRAFKERASVREFDNQKLTLQDLSDLLWAANGINREESGKRTAPSAMNAQDIDIFTILEEGIYLYDAKENNLKPIIKGDKRNLFSGAAKEPTTVPVILVLVSDISRFKRGSDTLKLSWAAMDAGIVSQNINIFCAGNGMITRTKAGMPHDELKKILNLSPTQYPLLNNPVSYKKK